MGRLPDDVLWTTGSTLKLLVEVNRFWAFWFEFEKIHGLESSISDALFCFIHFWENLRDIFVLAVGLGHQTDKKREEHISFYTGITYPSPWDLLLPLFLPWLLLRHQPLAQRPLCREPTTRRRRVRPCPWRKFTARVCVSLPHIIHIAHRRTTVTIYDSLYWNSWGISLQPE